MDLTELKTRVLQGMKDDLRLSRICRATRYHLVMGHEFYPNDVDRINGAIADCLQLLRDRKAFYRQMERKHVV
jgi:hypothetical protein